MCICPQLYNASRPPTRITSNLAAYPVVSKKHSANFFRIAANFVNTGNFLNILTFTTPTGPSSNEWALAEWNVCFKTCVAQLEAQPSDRTPPAAPQCEPQKLCAKKYFTNNFVCTTYAEH